jgi:hypothetical protein
LKLPQWLLAAALVCCAHPARPPIFSQLDATRNTDAVRQAARLAPQGYARAEQLRHEAERHWDVGHTASAQVNAERAMAAYDHSRTLVRIVRAERTLAEALAQVGKLQQALGMLQAQQKQAAAEQVDFEAQLKVERDAEQLANLQPASPEREAARREASRALAAQGRLLCAAARLLSETPAQFETQFKELDELDAELERQPVPTPIDTALRLRAGCLRAVTEIRRPKLAAMPQGTAGDELFVKLSAAHFEPSRDDRGVAVTLHDAFSGHDLTPATRSEIARLSKEYAALAVLVVVHAARNNASRDALRGRSAAEAMRQSGFERSEVSCVGDRLPLLARGQSADARRNERLEIVFVLPAS